MPVTPLLQQSIGMIEDYNQTLIPPIASSVANCFCAIQRPIDGGLQTELMTINDQNRLMWFYPDSVSGSGWDHDTIYVSGAPTAAISSVFSFYQGDQLYAFAGYANTGGGSSRLKGMMKSSTRGWIGVTYGANAENALSKMAQPATFADSDGTNYIYGVAEAFQPVPLFAIIGLNKGNFTVLYTEALAEGASYKLLPGATPGSFVILMLNGAEATFKGAAVNPSTGVIRLDGSSFTANLGVGALAAQNVLPAPRGSAAQPTFLLLATDGKLYMVEGDGLGTSRPPVLTLLTGGDNQPSAVLSATAGVQSTDLFSVFVIDKASNMVWSLSSFGGDYRWSPLGNQANAIAAPIEMAAGSEVFIYNLEARLIRLVQAPDTGSWFTYGIATPSPLDASIAQGTSYTFQFTLVDARTNAPLGGQVVSIFVDTPQVLVINSIAYHVTPSKPAVVAVEMNGQVTVASLASALASPVLTITGAIFGDQAQGPFRADLDLHKRLAGQDPDFPISGTVLKEQGFLPADTSQSDADNYADSIQQMGGVAVNIATDPTPFATGAPRSFRLSYSGGNFRCHEITTEEFAAVFDPGPQGLGGVFGDVANFFKHVWDDIEDIYVQVENAASKVANFVITVAGEVKSFVLNTIDDIRDGLEVIFQAMAKFFSEVIDFIKKAIEWLKLLFKWNNIIRTKRIYHHLLLQILQNLKSGIGPGGSLQAIVGEQINALNSNIRSYFQSIESVFGPTNTFNTLIPPDAGADNPELSGGPPLDAEPLTTQWQDNGVQANYILSKSIVSLPDAVQQAVAQLDGTDLGQELLQAFLSAIPVDEFQEDLASVLDYFRQVDSLGSLFDAVIYALLVATEDAVVLIISLVQAFLDVLFDLGATAIEALIVVFTRKIDIPVLSGLYRLIAKDEMTLLDLFCLIFAVPMTILHDIAYGKAPFTDDDVNTFEKMQIVWPWDQPAAQQMSQSEEELWAVVLTGAVVAGFVYAVTDTACDVANLGNEKIPGSKTTWSGINWISSLCSWVLNGPWLDNSMSAASTADKLNWAAWAVNALPILSDAVFLVSSGHKATRFVGTYGPVIQSVIGCTQMGVAIAAAVEFKGAVGYNRCNQAAVVLSPIANIAKPLALIGQSNPDAAMVVGALLGVLDFGSDLGAGILGAITTPQN